MNTVQVRDAKATLSSLIEAAERGEPTTITRHGKPAAVLVSVDDAQRLYPARRAGSLVEHLMRIPEAIDVERDQTPLRSVDL